MSFEHSNEKPEYFKEDWEGQDTIFSWMSYVTAIPHVIFMVTTLKENGQPNAGLQGWSLFSGEGDHYYVLMSTLMKHTHTYQNIIRTGEFCINFLSSKYADQCKKSIRLNDDSIDEIAASGFTALPSHAIDAPSIAESFLRLECRFEWEKELRPESVCRIVCGRVQHISANDDFARSKVDGRYGKDSFMFHLMAMKDPYTGDRITGGIGQIELTSELEL